MTKLLQEAFAELQQLGDDEQDAIALEIMAIVANRPDLGASGNDDGNAFGELASSSADPAGTMETLSVSDIEALEPETRAAVLEGLAQAERGEFVSDEDIEAFFSRHRQ